MKNLVEVNRLVKYFPVKGGFFNREVASVKAVDEVTFSIKECETFGLVGESGCGKTTIGKLLAGLINPTSGEVRFNGGVHGSKEKTSQKLSVQMVFQNPQDSLDPRMRVRDIIGEPLKVRGVTGSEFEELVGKILYTVRLDAGVISSYPYELSQGQKQRVGIARALVVKPEFVVLDEPTSALDVSIQAKILNDLDELKEAFGTTYLFISHNLAVVDYMCETIAVMYLGKIVEIGTADELSKNPMHPYTQALYSSQPDLSRISSSNRVSLEGEVPSPIDPPSGCRFRTRCPYAMSVCQTEPRLLRASEEHYVACHLVNS